MAQKFPSTKNFNGKKYWLHTYFRSENAAKNEADRYRKKYGYRTRVVRKIIDYLDYYAVYTRPPIP